MLERQEQRSLTGMNLADVDLFLGSLDVLMERVDVQWLWRPQLQDADDEFVLDAAINGRADALVTHNVRDFEAAGRRFRLRIATPGDVLRTLRS